MIRTILSFVKVRILQAAVAFTNQEQIFYSVTDYISKGRSRENLKTVAPPPIFCCYYLETMGFNILIIKCRNVGAVSKNREYILWGTVKTATNQNGYRSKVNV